MAVLIDTSFLLASIFVNDKNHVKVRRAVQSLNVAKSIVPAPVLQELFYMTTARRGYEEGIRYFDQTRKAGFDIQPLIAEDMTRMTEIMWQYADAQLDYTDTAIMALSERLNIRQVYTFDHRDFHLFRPKHCKYLELLPELR